MLHIVCVNAGNYLGRGAEYANILFDMVRRNLPEGFPGTFECFTDDPTGLDPGITPRELPKGLNGWFNKLYLFKEGVFPDGDRVLYFDLDTVITGRLDEIAAYDGNFAILCDLFQPLDRRYSGWQSAIMAWRAGYAPHVWSNFEAAGFPDVEGGDQAWIRSQLDSADLWQFRYPGCVVSYKATAGRVPTKASMVCFHGKPRPHEVKWGWVPQVWKIGGFTRADLDKVCNTETARLVDNVRKACKRNHPWVDTKDIHDGHAVIVGGGPSINGRTEELLWRFSLGQSIWALNGSAKWLRQHGIIPNYHVIADARPENVDFLHDVHSSTEYLIASQCDPRVFNKLALYNTSVWHPNIDAFRPIIEECNIKDKPVHLFGGGSTVGLNAITLAFGLGYRKFHLYGFDSSYAKGGAHHAYAQPLNDGQLVIDTVCGDETFKSSPWMVQQVNEFERLAIELLEDDCVITVHGDGLLPAIARDMMAHPRMTTADVRAEEILKRIGNLEKPVGVEIGVFAADLSRVLLRGKDDLYLYMVDPWEAGGASYAEPGGAGDWHITLTQDEQDRFCEAATDRTRFAGDRREILRLRSTDAAKKINGLKLDFAFIDGDHSYEGCKADIEAWAPKIAPGGWLCGHDYDNPYYEKFGVKRAVDEFVAKTGKSLELADDTTWFIRL